MNQGAVLHKGLLLDCRVCNPPTETQEKRVRRARSKTGVSLDVVIRRQVAFDLGEDEPKKDERFQLLQKYGVAAPRIDRQMTKPNWMGVAEWKLKLNDWYKLTKGLVAPQQQRREYHGKVFNRNVRPDGHQSQRHVSSMLQKGVGENSEGSRVQRQQKTYRSIRDYSRREEKSSQEARRAVRSMSKENRSFGDRP